MENCCCRVVSSSTAQSKYEAGVSSVISPDVQVDRWTVWNVCCTHLQPTSEMPLQSISLSDISLGPVFLLSPSHSSSSPASSSLSCSLLSLSSVLFLCLVLLFSLLPDIFPLRSSSSRFFFYCSSLFNSFPFPSFCRVPLDCTAAHKVTTAGCVFFLLLRLFWFASLDWFRCGLRLFANCSVNALSYIYDSPSSIKAPPSILIFSHNKKKTTLHH